MTAYISECGYCHETQFTQWHSKRAPRDRYGRVDRDYLDSQPVAYCSEEHRDAADALYDAIRAEVLRGAEASVRAVAAEKSGLADELMRRDLEEEAQVWHLAADVVARLARAEEKTTASAAAVTPQPDPAVLRDLAPRRHAVTTYDPESGSIHLELAATREQWAAWEKALAVDLARTTNRGGTVTSHATWRGLHVAVRCHLTDSRKDGGR